MAATKIEIKLKTIEVLDSSEFFGPGDWSFIAKITTKPSNTTVDFSKSKTFEAKKKGQVFKPGWKHTIDIDPKDKVFEVELSGKDDDLLVDDDLGKIKLTLNTPIIHDYNVSVYSSKRKYNARFEVKIKKLAGKLIKRGVSTIRTDLRSSDYTTVHREMLSRCVQICPVIPVPWAKGLPPTPQGIKPMTASPQENLAIGASDTKHNSLVNPSVIVVQDPKNDKFDDKVARIYITQFRPDNLDLSKLIWKAKTDNIKLYNGKKGVTQIKGGREIKAYGVLNGDADEMGEINVHWDSEGEPLLAKFIAWVGKPKCIVARANIIKTTKALSQNPTITPAQIKGHIAFSNVILWQAGIQITLDQDDTAYNGAIKKDTGIFEINSATDHTFNVTYNNRMAAPLLNQRSGVFNLAYLHSCAGEPNLLGAASDRMMSLAKGKVDLKTSPSISWLRPTGIFPDKPAGKITMERMGPSLKRADNLKNLAGDKNLDTISACIITEIDAKNGSVTLPHELGHVLGLHHRGSGATDLAPSSGDLVNHLDGPNKGEGHPWNENLMSYGNDGEAQDIDTIQAQVIRSHKLVQDLPSKPKPKPKPKEKKTFPKEYLPSKDDKIMLQEYLIGTRPGLKKSGYDLGTSGPDSNGVDGIVGTKTKNGVREFQKAFGGLGVDGIYGPNTAAAFASELNPA